jgi:hypothetical protein
VNIAREKPDRMAWAGAIAGLLATGTAQAFPVTDPSNPAIVTEAPEPTESDLRHQLQMSPGFTAAAAERAWTIVPSISLGEIFTDNVLNTPTNRRSDLLTVLTPGISITGDTPRAQVQFSYGPQFLLAARTPEENRVTQQLLGTGLFTVVPDEVFVDVRAVAGGAPIGSGFAALSPGLNQSVGTSGTGVGPNSFGTAGLSKQNLVQTTSTSIAPYWLHPFSDIGTAKIGYQFNQSSFSQGNSFFPLFYPTGSNTVRSITNEGIAQFETGERFAPFRDLVVADALIGNGNGFEGDSAQYTFVNRLGYQIAQQVGVFGELGYENLRFDGTPTTRINDAIWGIGTTYTPNPDSRITVSYGHRYGQNAVQVDGSYAVTARTRVSASYLTGLQTDLQSISSQLDLASLTSTGQAVDAQTGAPLFIGTGGLGVQAGLFRTKALTMSASTTWDRDQVSLSLQWSQNTTVSTVAPNTVVPFGIPAPPVGSTSRGTTIYASWVHQLSDVLTLSSGAAYGTSRGFGTGDEQSVSASVGIQYLLTETWTTYARYSYFNQVSSTPGVGYYQNLVLVGVTKTF